MFTAPPPEVGLAALRALKTIAQSDGEFHEVERAILATVQTKLLGTDYDLDALEPITPEALAEAVPPGEVRRCLVGGCVIVAIMDGTIDPNEKELVKAYARALEVDEAAVRDMERFSKHQLFALRLGILRRFEPAILVEKEYRERGLRGMVRFFKQALHIGDAKLTAKYRALEALPEGTLGREYFEFVQSHGYPFPGEKGSEPEVIVSHDCNHVLGEYGTSPAEEALLGAFQAGYHHVDPFGLLMFSIVHFHLGVRICPVAPPETGLVDPEQLVTHFARGTAVTRDLFEDWDPEKDFERPVAELRRELGIAPRTDSA